MSHYQNRHPNFGKHTNLPNEIETTEDTPSDRFIILVAIAIVLGLAVVIMK